MNYKLIRIMDLTPDENGVISHDLDKFGKIGYTAIMLEELKDGSLLILMEQPDEDDEPDIPFFLVGGME